MSVKRPNGLRFPCECVSGLSGGYTDPWADVTKRKLLPNGTKEQIVTLLAQEPKTISQLAQALKLSVPSVYSHVNDMLESELLRESEEFEKKHPTERYYEPNFPVFKAEECAEFHTVCEAMAEDLATLFQRRLTKIERAFGKTSLPEHGWQLSDVTQCLYANMYRTARRILEQRGLLASQVKHANGAEWIFWAEERDDDGRK
jgi:DNA-binding transcriptional ArsR family regulator